ncbi:hypothetical protein LSAT2_006149 [Lamellibrachia satsuma]|nr:hypothetical protein LSAT2_006149 [Lamellibrachia satsuma]
MAVALNHPAGLSWSLVERDYCQWETFNATCRSTEVIVIANARYGRMQAGRCADQNYGHLGCSVSVLGHIDSLCSGRHQCKFVVPDSSLRRMSPCPKDFTPYLRSSYRCVPVESRKGRHCVGGSALPVRVTSDGFLASVVTIETGLGSTECPWRLAVPAGQRINLTLYDFLVPQYSPNDVPIDDGGRQGDTGRDVDTRRQGDTERHGATYCHRYASIRERGAVRSTIVCGGETRLKVVYLSSTNQVDLTVSTYRLPEKRAMFLIKYQGTYLIKYQGTPLIKYQGTSLIKYQGTSLIKYQAIGCPTLEPPKNGWMAVDGDVIAMHCNTTRDRWSLKCVGNHWVGRTELNCSGNSVMTTESIWNTVGDDWSSPLGILVVSALGVVLGLIIGLAMLSVVMVAVRRHKTVCCLGHDPYDEDAAKYAAEQTASVGYVLTNKRHSSSALVDQLELTNVSESGNYGATWRARPPSYVLEARNVSFVPADDVKAPAVQRIVNGYPPHGTSPRRSEAAAMKPTDVGSYTATTTTFRCNGSSVGGRGQ